MSSYKKEGTIPQETLTGEGEITEPLPDKLENLERILVEHGIKRRDAVLRSMSLREPEDLQELMWALDDIGVNRSTQRRIISDYAKWLGIKIPDPVIQALNPRTQPEFEPSPKYDRWGRRITEEEGRRVPSEMEGIAELFRAFADVYQSMQPRQPAYNSESNAYRTMYEEEKKRSEQLRDELRKAEIQSLRSEFDAKLAQSSRSIDEKLAERIEKPLTRLGDVGERLVEGAIASEFPQRPPKREKLGESDVFSLMPEEYKE